MARSVCSLVAVPVASALAMAGLWACSDPGTGPEAAPVLFPLEVGNSWTYAPESPQFGDPFQWEVTGRNGERVTLSRPPGGSHPGPVTLRDGQEAIDLVLEGEEALPYLRFVQGSSWIHRDPWECDDGSLWVAAKEETPIHTPAGTFTNTIRLERRTAATCTDAGTTFEWWAPEVGLVRWEELNFYAGGPLVFDLVSYSVG
jgi:hypothetical protein